MVPASIRIEDASAAAEARRMAVAAAMMEGLDEEGRGAVAIVASEIATNLHKHARGGEMLITRTSPRGGPGVELLSIDRGPGIPDVRKVFADGYSSSATAGTGLGAIRRMGSDFDIYSQSGKGTVMVTRICRDKADRRSTMALGAVSRAKSGEQVCGDAWAIRQNGSWIILMVADGLGHGDLAAHASETAASAFAKSDSVEPRTALDQVHRALRRTRGAAVAIAAVDRKARRIRYAGLGNISGVVLGGEKERHMVSQNGTAGHEARSMHEFEYELPDRGLVVMHSDGLTSTWNLTPYPGLLQHDPALVAAVLYRDANRERDDVCVLAVRF